MIVEVPAPWIEHLDMVTIALRDLDIEVGGERGTGPGPVAFAALPFDRRVGARFIIPALVQCVTRETTTTSQIGPHEVAPTAPTSAFEPTTLELRAVRPVQQWCAAVEAARDRIAAGALAKVVLAREVRVRADGPFDVLGVAERLATAYPHALRYSVDGFVGASPELLVGRFGDVVRAQPMAGTTARTGDEEIDRRCAAELLLSDKNRVEHQITIDMVHETVLPWCSYLDAEPGPTVVAAGPVQHLATLVEGRLSHPAPSVLDLVAALHPTPAVGGWPRDPALALIDELEDADRGRYAGPVGWVDRDGNGEWAVGIRGVEIVDNVARIFAGTGVVADSDPLAELEETRAKLESTLRHIARL